MTFMIAAAGTGGHVFPGLSVGEALLDLGVARDDILYVGGDRLEADIYPDEGFGFLGLELRGLQRSLTLKNLTLPAVVARARSRISQAIREYQVRCVLGMGGYVTIPAGSAASKMGVSFFISEQNAEAGLANRVARRWAQRAFASFPETGGLEDAEWVGNPVRRPFWAFARNELRHDALHRYELRPDVPVLGVFGGSLGAAVINDAISALAGSWSGRPIQIVHVTGARNLEVMKTRDSTPEVMWRRIGFEESMQMFYAASDLVVARAGGAVAELIATATPGILVPGEFGSSGHQKGNARFLTEAGATVTVFEPELAKLADLVRDTLFEPQALSRMRIAAEGIARPEAAHTVARAMMEVSD